jgi:hypothetical protein
MLSRSALQIPQREIVRARAVASSNSFNIAHGKISGEPGGGSS